MPNKDSIIAKAAGAFDKVRPGLLADARMFLLKRSGETQRFTVIDEITSGFWSRWSSYREQSVFMWADASGEWLDKVAQTSHIGFGVPDADAKIDVFAISPDQRDRLAPSGANLIWKLYGIRAAAERFAIPEP
jgi:hypothetical protein